MPYIGKKPADIIATAVDTTTGTFSGTLGVTGETTLATHLNMGDGDIIKLGASADLQIYHDGSRSIIQDNGTGNLRIQANNLELNNADNSENYLFAANNGAVSLYYDNAVKLATTSTGIDVTGGVSIDDDNNFSFGDGTTYIQGSGAADRLKFITNASEAMRIDSSGNVGIGVVPNTSWHSTLTALQLGGNGSLSAQSSAGASKQIYLSQNVFNDGDQKYISTDEASNYLQQNGTHIFQVASSGSANAVISWNTAMTLDNSGNLLVGTTDNQLFDNTSGGGLCYRPSLSLDIAREATSSSNSMLTLNNTGVDARFIDFRKDATTVGNIGTVNGDLTIFSSASGHCGIRFLNDPSIRPTDNTGAVSDGTVNLGDASHRFKDLYLSGGVTTGTESNFVSATSTNVVAKSTNGNGGYLNYSGLSSGGTTTFSVTHNGKIYAADGIQLGGTGSANHLQDYEEGTWTPNLGPSNASFTSVTYATRVGKYTKIGNIVTISCRIATSAITIGSGSGNAQITNLPFTSSSSSAPGSAISFNANWASGNPAFAYLLDNETTVRLHQTPAAGAYNLGTPSTVGNLNTGSNSNYIYFVLTYETT